MITRTFTWDELEEMGLPYSAPIHQPLEEHRWYTTVRVVFRYDDEAWAVDWLRPATEMQEGQDEWATDPVVAYRVEERQVVTSIWEPINSEVDS